MKKSKWSTAPDHLVSRWARHDNVGKNTEMWLTPEDAKKITGRGRGLRGTVTDHKSKKTFKVYGAYISPVSGSRYGPKKFEEEE